MLFKNYFKNISLNKSVTVSVDKIKKLYIASLYFFQYIVCSFKRKMIYNERKTEKLMFFICVQTKV